MGMEKGYKKNACKHDRDCSRRSSACENEPLGYFFPKGYTSETDNLVRTDDTDSGSTGDNSGSSKHYGQ